MEKKGLNHLHDPRISLWEEKKMTCCSKYHSTKLKAHVETARILPLWANAFKGVVDLCRSSPGSLWTNTWGEGTCHMMSCADQILLHVVPQQLTFYNSMHTVTTTQRENKRPSAVFLMGTLNNKNALGRCFYK